MTVGTQAGNSFMLDPTDENLIGRGVDCAVVLTDPLCSRVHAIIRQTDQAWHIRDAGSSNGTFVNDCKIDEAVLVDGHHVRIGSTEFAFHLSDQPPTVGPLPEPNMTQTVVKEQFIGGEPQDPSAVAVLGDAEQAHALLLLYQLSIKLMGCDDPDEVIRISLELLQEWTHATVAGFWAIADDGTLRPKLLLPPDGTEQLLLSRPLTEMVCHQGRAVWIANQRGRTESIAHDADAICVPLLQAGRTIGAIQCSLQKGRFRQSDFDFAISLANIAVVALVRARRETSLHNDYERLAAKNLAAGELIGESPPMRELKAKITRLGRAAGCVLVRGESGSGKELVARALHRVSPRIDQPLLCVNCAAIPPDLMESQLFGHKAGSFTGADRDHAGFFQQADLGTLFLDEVGELTLEGQAKLLRILEGHPFLPVGSTREVTVDVRVIAATNQDLQSYVRARKFREDLYYRLSVFELFVPPLRERSSDIALLVDYFFDHFRRQRGRPNLGFSDQARTKLLAYPWPGNVRQLRNVIDSAVVLAEEDKIDVEDLGLRDAAGTEMETLSLESWERRLISEALRRTNGNMPEAAGLLGISRATLYRKVEQYGLGKS
jgi:two-component system response regulator HydG